MTSPYPHPYGVSDLTVTPSTEDTVSVVETTRLDLPIAHLRALRAIEATPLHAVELYRGNTDLPDVTIAQAVWLLDRGFLTEEPTGWVSTYVMNARGRRVLELAKEVV